VPSSTARLGWIMLAAVLLAATGMRFYHPAQSPHGFFRDEAAISANVLCLAEAGRTLDGNRWPLMTPVLGGGYSTAAWLTPAVAWADVAGTSIAAMRSFAAVCGALLVAGAFLLGFVATDSIRAGAYSALAAAISPWAFQFSRIVWDPAVAPVYLTWALVALMFAVTQRAETVRWLRGAAIVVSAFLFAAACISYPPLRVQVPLLLLGVLIWKRAYARAHVADSVLFVVVFAVCTAQLWQLTRHGAIQGRFDDLSVFSAAHWAEQGVTGRGAILLRGTWLFVGNFFAHFTPRYLLGGGDANLRHSTQAFGEWSWLDAAALATGAVVMIRAKRLDGWTRFVVFGYVAGVVPAALTWEGVPHALRSIGALPFLAVLVGTLVDRVGMELPRMRGSMPAIASVVSFAFVAAFWPVFFVDYPGRAADAFESGIPQALKDPAVARRLPTVDAQQSAKADDEQDYPVPALRYYELTMGDAHCAPSGPVWRPGE
jgi:hypothetical protein